LNVCRLVLYLVVCRSFPNSPLQFRVSSYFLCV
jgi:hypothetical protein